MTDDNRRRIRLDVDADEIKQIAQLRAHFSRINGSVVTAHNILGIALDNLHQKVFEEENHSIPHTWRSYEQ